MAGRDAAHRTHPAGALTTPQRFRFRSESIESRLGAVEQTCWAQEYATGRAVVVRQLSLPVFQQLERAHSSPQPARQQSVGGVQRSPPRRRGRSVLRSLEPRELCSVQNAVVQATTEYGSALLMLPLPPPPPLGAASDGAEGADEGWLGAVSELSSGLPPCLMVHNPTTAVISTRV